MDLDFFNEPSPSHGPAARAQGSGSNLDYAARSASREARNSALLWPKSQPVANHSDPKTPEPPGRRDHSARQQYQSLAQANADLSALASMGLGQFSMPSTSRAPVGQSQPTRRNRMNSTESFGSSVMPAALPFGRNQSAGLAGSRSMKNLRAPDHNSSIPPIPSAGLHSWLQSQKPPTAPPIAEDYANGDADDVLGSIYTQRGAPTAQGFPSFAPSGRVRRLGSDAGSATGDGSVGGWSTGVRSVGGNRKSKGSGRDKTRVRSGLPLWEGQSGVAEEEEEPGTDQDGKQRLSDGLDSIHEWRTSSALPSNASTAFDQEYTPRSRQPSGSYSVLSGRQPTGPRSASVAGSVRARVMIADQLGDSGSQQPDWTPLRSAVRGINKAGISPAMITLFAIQIGFVNKWAFSMGGWSGGEVRGGWETLRHWMSLTMNVPAEEWYTYDLDHRLLDRPPLAAYLSWAFGKLMTACSDFGKSFGFPPEMPKEGASTAHSLLSLIVIAASVVLYVAPVLFFLSRRLSDRSRRTRAIAAASILFQPALILADSCLGELRSPGLGLLTASLAFLSTSLPNADDATDKLFDSGSDRLKRIKHLSRQVSYSYVAASACFLYSLFLDQTAVLFAPVAASLLIGRWVGLSAIGFRRGLTLLLGVLLVVTLTFAIFLAPWLSVTSLTPLSSIFERLAGSSSHGGSRATAKASLFSAVQVHRLPLGTNSRFTALALSLLTCFYPSLLLFRGAKETVKIEMHLNESLETSQAKPEPPRARRDRTVSNATSRASGFRRGEPSEDGRAGQTSSHRRSNSGRVSKRAASAAASDAGSDLRSFAESLVGRTTDAQTYPTSTGLDSHGRDSTTKVASSCPSPAAAILPYAGLAVSLGMYLLGNLPGSSSPLSASQSLFPLLPLTLLLTAKGDEWGGGACKTDWEWAVMANNVVFSSLGSSMRSSGMPLRGLVIVTFWNWLIGWRPWEVLTDPTRRSTAAVLSSILGGASLFAHFLSVSGGLSEAQLQAMDTTCLGILYVTFTILYFWALKRTVEVALGNGISIGLTLWSTKKERSKGASTKSGKR